MWPRCAPSGRDRLRSWTFADGTIVQRGTKWAALHNRVWGVFFVHEQDVGGLDPIETPD